MIFRGSKSNTEKKKKTQSVKKIWDEWNLIFTICHCLIFCITYTSCTCPSSPTVLFLQFCSSLFYLSGATLHIYRLHYFAILHFPRMSFRIQSCISTVYASLSQFFFFFFRNDQLCLVCILANVIAALSVTAIWSVCLSHSHLFVT